MQLRLSACLVFFSLLANAEGVPRNESATIPGTSRINRPVVPLPYFASWNVGEAPETFDPAHQLELIDRGHQIFLSFLMPSLEASTSDSRWTSYYEPAIRKAAAQRLPIALVGTQWENQLSLNPAYSGLPPGLNPNAPNAGEGPGKQVSPFGDLAQWNTVGRAWSGSRMIERLQDLYPDPPLVLFVSNNEHPKLEWKMLESDPRSKDYLPRNASDADLRRAASNGWIERYRSLLQGMRAGLKSDVWRKNATFIGYQAFGPGFIGRWPNWTRYSLHIDGRVSPWPNVWDGASVPYYLHNWLNIYDFTVFSPQVEAMNWIFMLVEAREVNPNFWLEMSTWDGHHEGSPDDKYKSFRNLNQDFTPERYKGMVQFGMWLLRPRGVREFRFLREKVAETEAFRLPILSAIDRVHTDPELRAFWQSGELVANPHRKHPYQQNIPVEYQQKARWFMLNSSVDPVEPWTLSTQLPVYALALVLDDAPRRKWLVYSHAPMGDREKVRLDIPNFHRITVDVSQAGSFYVVEEEGEVVKPIH